MEDIISALEKDGTEWALQQIEVPKWRWLHFHFLSNFFMFVLSHIIFVQWDD